MSPGNEICREPRSDLDDYLDGELSEARRQELGAHLETCGVCRGEVEELRALRLAVRSLPGEISPQRDLWPELSTRLEPRTVRAPDRTSWRVLWQVAAALGFLVLGAGLQRWLDTPPSPRMAPPGGEIVLAAAGGGNAEFLLAEAEVLRAKETLRLAFERQRDELSPSTLKVVERNLSIIDEALADLRAALEEDPGNPRLQELLLARHRQQVELMRRLAS